jgi:hypothetical protein
MAIKTDPYTFTNITIADALEVNARFDELYNLQNGTIDADNMDLTDNFTWTGTHTYSATLLKVKGAGAGVASLQNASTATNRTITIPDTGYNITVASAAQLPPVGTIVAHYDFDAAVSIDTDHWQYCNGGTVSNANSSINGETLPDLSNRYLVGFGTEGGTDIDSATWATATVGNASHQVNLQHAHTMTGHAHGMQSHTHNVDISSFSISLQAAAGYGSYLKGEKIGWKSGDGNQVMYKWSTGGSETMAHAMGKANVNPPNTTSASPSNNTTTSVSDSMNNQLSATQTIQPRSIRVRWIMRIV